METEIKFCEDCKWCSSNYLGLFSRLSFSGGLAKCMRPECLTVPVARKDTLHADFCSTVRKVESLCGMKGNYYEQAD